MKQRIQGIIIGILITATFMGSVTAVWAAAVWKKIDVAYNDYKVVVNGNKFIPRDVDGSAMELMNYNGWIWAPFEKIADELGMDTGWDGTTNTLYLNTPAFPPPPKPKTTYLGVDLLAYEAINTTSTYTTFAENQSFKMLGNTYSGCTYLNRMSASGTAYNGSVKASYSLNGQYRLLKGTLGRVDGSGTKAGTFTIYLENRFYNEYPLSGTMSSQEIIIDVTDVRVIQITFSVSGSGTANTQYGFGNVTIE